MSVKWWGFFPPVEFFFLPAWLVKLSFLYWDNKHFFSLLQRGDEKEKGEEGREKRRMMLLAVGDDDDNNNDDGDDMVTVSLEMSFWKKLAISHF